jgi:hypothetical protein
MTILYFDLIHFEDDSNPSAVGYFLKVKKRAFLSGALL